MSSYGKWIRTIYNYKLNKGFSSKFHVGSQAQHETPEKGQSTH